MLTKLLPEQISKFWDVIRYALENAPPLTTEVHYESWVNELLSSALSGRIEVWASYDKGDTLKLNGITLTSFEVDRFIRTKSLLIYYVYTYSLATPDAWIEALRKLAEYAKSRGCTRIVAYSNVKEMIEIANKLGGDTSVTFITFNIKDLV